MKFPYKRIAVHLWRPIIAINVRHPVTRKSIRYFALVDSGADNCIFGAEIAELIGIDVEAGKKNTVSGVVAGQSRPYYLHEVEIEIGGWWKKTTVGFMPALSKNGHGFVGRDGFFDRFSFIKFEQPKAMVEFGTHL